MNTVQPEDWNGRPEVVGEAWTLRKVKAVARCTLVTHPLGFELRLVTTDLIRSQVCRSTEEVLNTHEQWKAALLAEGWTQA